MPTKRSLFKQTLKRLVTCKCPRCGQEHVRYFDWTGEGTPRKYCEICAQFVSEFVYDDDLGFAVLIS